MQLSKKSTKSSKPTQTDGMTDKKSSSAKSATKTKVVTKPEKTTTKRPIYPKKNSISGVTKNELIDRLENKVAELETHLAIKKIQLNVLHEKIADLEAENSKFKVSKSWFHKLLNVYK